MRDDLSYLLEQDEVQPVIQDESIEAIFSEPMPDAQPELLTGFLSADYATRQYIQFSNMAQSATSKSYRELWESQANSYKSEYSY